MATIKSLQRKTEGNNLFNNLSVRNADATCDFDNKDLQSMKSMEIVLSNVSQVHSKCSATETTLRAKIHKIEGKLLALRRKITSYTTQIAVGTMPKSLHSLSMLLTVDYCSLQPEKQELPNKQRIQQKDLYHYAIFSDNVIACAVVVNSTISTSMVRATSFFCSVCWTLRLN